MAVVEANVMATMAIGSRTARTALLPSWTPSRCFTTRQSPLSPAGLPLSAMIRSARVLLNFGARRRGFKAGRHEKPDFLTEFHRPAKAFLMANKLTKLGRQVRLPRSPDEAALERVANPHRSEEHTSELQSHSFISNAVS